MKVPIRTTANGTEYWDNIEKRTVFVPAGVEPNFEVTENPKSMIAGIDLATGKDLTINNTQPDGPITLFAEMTIKDLRAYAKQKEITIPLSIKKQEDIAAFLCEETLSEGAMIEDDKK